MPSGGFWPPFFNQCPLRGALLFYQVQAWICESDVTVNNTVYQLAADAAALAGRVRAAITSNADSDLDAEQPQGRCARVRATWGHSKWRGALQACVTPLGLAADAVKAAVNVVGTVGAGLLGVVAALGGGIWFAAQWVANKVKALAERAIGCFDAEATPDEQAS